MLFAFADFCDEHGLYYSLSDGTLLGAIRHQGFIPWDDDIDLCMPRPDYERLIGLEDELKAETGYDLVNARNGKMPRPFSKVLDPTVEVREACWHDRYALQGLWLDVFPVDGLPADSEERNALFASRDADLRKMWLVTLDYGKMGGGMKNRLKGLAATVARRFFDPYDISHRIEAQASSYGFDKADLVADVVYDPAFREGIKREAFFQGEPVTFEGRTLNAMSCWDEMLTKEYGDYMQLPPEDQRASHSLE